MPNYNTFFANHRFELDSTKIISNFLKMLFLLDISYAADTKKKGRFLMRFLIAFLAIIAVFPNQPVRAAVTVTGIATSGATDFRLTSFPTNSFKAVIKTSIPTDIFAFKDFETWSYIIHRDGSSEWAGDTLGSLQYKSSSAARQHVFAIFAPSYIIDWYGPSYEITGFDYQPANIGISASNGAPFTYSATFTPFAYSVPEPATWVMMLLGFWAIGAALRFRPLQRPQPAS